MVSKKLLLVSILLLFCVLVFAGGSKESEEQIVLKLGYSSPTSIPWHTCA